MTVIATDSTRFSAVVKWELEPSVGVCRESIIINDTGATLKVGTVLGKVTATGKYKVALNAAVDGSQTPVAVLIADGLGLSGDVTIPNNTDYKCLALAHGPAIVADSALVLGTGITALIAKNGLAAVGIIVETAV
jgi:hypothetical protein